MAKLKSLCVVWLYAYVPSITVMACSTIKSARYRRRVVQWFSLSYSSFQFFSALFADPTIQRTMVTLRTCYILPPAAQVLSKVALVLSSLVAQDLPLHPGSPGPPLEHLHEASGNGSQLTPYQDPSS